MVEQKNDKQDVPIELLDYAKSNFDLSASDFDHLDSKAIGVLGITGLLVSLQAGNLDNLVYFFGVFVNGKLFGLTCIGLFILTIYSISLVCCIIFALRSFQVRDLNYPTDVMKIVERFRNIDDTKEKTSASLKIDIVKAYANSTSDIEQKNAEKARCLKQAVTSIFAAILSLIFLLLLIFIHKSLL